MANSTEKMTNSKAISYVLNLEGLTLPDDVKEKLTNIKASIDKKNGAEKKPTATQKENIGIKNAILAGMADKTSYTITELQKSNADIAELTNQKISALMRQLVEEGSVTKDTVKGKSVFTKVVAE